MTIRYRIDAKPRSSSREQITIATAHADDLDPVMADVTQLEQLLVNLSVNGPRRRVSKRAPLATAAELGNGCGLVAGQV